MVQSSSSVAVAARVLKLLTRYRLAHATLTQIAVEVSPVCTHLTYRVQR